MPNYINAEEIAVKLSRKRMHWDRVPTVSVHMGNDSRFGEIIFNFNELDENNPEEIETLKLMISSDEEREKILKMAETAVDNFADILDHHDRKYFEKKR